MAEAPGEFISKVIIIMTFDIIYLPQRNFWSRLDLTYFVVLIFNYIQIKYFREVEVQFEIGFHRDRMHPSLNYFIFPF